MTVLSVYDLNTFSTSSSCNRQSVSGNMTHLSHRRAPWACDASETPFPKTEALEDCGGHGRVVITFKLVY